MSNVGGNAPTSSGGSVLDRPANAASAPGGAGHSRSRSGTRTGTGPRPPGGAGRIRGPRSDPQVTRPVRGYHAPAFDRSSI
jgi:hypothetical protein